jgi:hypothetical protein
MPAEEIDAMELELKEEAVAADDGGESCSAELSNIESMRDWM